MIDAHKNAFIEEASELLSELENTLLEAERNPKDIELIARIFRALHTIKGSSGMFGYDEITMFTHDIETVYDFIRNGKLVITKNIIDLTLAARDQIFLMLKNDGSSSVDENKTKEIIASFRNLVTEVKKEDKEKVDVEHANISTSKTNQTEEIKTYLIKFVPDADIFMTGTNPLALIRELKTLGASIVLGNFENVPALENINPEKCYSFWEIILQTGKGIDAIKDVFIFVEDQCELVLEIIDEQGKLRKNEDFKEFENLLKSISKSKHPDIKNLLIEFQTSVSAEESIHTLKNNLHAKENQEHHRESEAVSSIRVSAEKLDELVNLVGELVSLQARLSQLAFNSNDQNLSSVSEEVERITWSLRDSALNIRMLPIGTTFSKFKRLVRDLSKELGKELELTTDGAETELDKTVIEKLNDPLIHIIRNCVDHGIETPAEREKAGKSRAGWIQLSAKQTGGNVIIDITDDGAGLNKEAIKEKAVRLGMIAENAELSDAEIFALIFSAGFSTAKKVTNVSGRGVGMDVVKRAIESLRGTIEVTSKQGEGTTISLKLPLTLAIIDGLLVKIDDEHFILPLSSVEECIELTQKQIELAHGRNIINIRGKVVPYINLRQKFNIKNKRPDIEQIVVAEINGTQVGFVVDNVLGQHQTVLKSLGRFYKNVEGVSGATILGDGTVALILDLIKIVDSEELVEKTLVC